MSRARLLAAILLVLCGLTLLAGTGASASGLTADFACAPSCSVTVGATVKFQATSSATKPGYSWDLEGRNPPTFADATGPESARTFSSPGTYPIALRVEDTSDKQQVVVTHDVTVTAAAAPPTADPPVTETFDTLNPGTTLKATAAGVTFPQGAQVGYPRNVAPWSFPSALESSTSELEACFHTPTSSVSLYAGVDDKKAPSSGTWARLVAFDASGKAIDTSPDIEVAQPGERSSLDTQLQVSDQAARIACVGYHVGTGTTSHDTGARTAIIDDLTTTFNEGAVTAPSITIDQPADGTVVPFGSPAPVTAGGTVETPNGLQNLCVVAGTDEPDWAHCFQNLTLPGHESVRGDHYGVGMPILHTGANVITAWVRDDHNRIAHATATITLSSPPVTSYDLSIGAIEVTQAVQPETLPAFSEGVSAPTPGITQSYPVGHDTGVLLAAGKQTIVRVYLDTTNVPRGFRVDARLYGYQAGIGAPAPAELLPGSPVSSATGPVSFIPYGNGIAGQRGDPRDAVTFNVPESWTTPVAKRFVVQLIPQPDTPTLVAHSTDGWVAGLDGVPFVAVGSARLSPFAQFVTSPHEVHPPMNPVPIFDDLRAILPVSDHAFLVQSPYVMTMDVSGVAGGVFDPDLPLVQSLDATIGVGGCATCVGQPIAVIPGNGVPVNHSFTMFPPITGHPVSVVEAPRGLTAVAHEVGHLLGRAHASGSCGGGGTLGIGGGEAWPPDDRGYLQGVGTDPLAGDMVGPGEYHVIDPGDDGQPHDYDYMSYCNDSDPGSDNCYEACSWVSPKGWTELLAAQSRNPPVLAAPRAALTASVAAARPDLHVLAAVEPGGKVTIVSVRPGAKVRSGGQLETSFKLVGRSARGRRLQEVTMRGSFAHIDHHSQTLFLVGSLSPRGIAEVQVLNGGHVAATRRRPRTTPRVSVVFPRQGTKLSGHGEVKLRWRVTHAPRHTPHVATIFYSADGGAHYRTIALTAKDSMDLPAAMFQKSRRARVEVTVNDGFDDATAKSGLFSSPGTAPHVAIFTPGSKLTSSRYGILQLDGQAFDDRGQVISDKHLKWFAGKRPIATGRTASVTGLTGAKVKIRLVARDYADRRGSATVYVHLFTPQGV